MPATTLRSHLAYLLAEAEQAVNRGLAESLGEEGVTVEQWRILRALSDGYGHSMGDLAAAVLMPHPTLTKAVDRLVERRAVVYRRQDRRPTGAGWRCSWPTAAANLVRRLDGRDRPSTTTGSRPPTARSGPSG